MHTRIANQNQMSTHKPTQNEREKRQIEKLSYREIEKRSHHINTLKSPLKYGAESQNPIL